MLVQSQLLAYSGRKCDNFAWEIVIKGILETILRYTLLHLVASRNSLGLCEVFRVSYRAKSNKQPLRHQREPDVCVRDI